MDALIKENHSLYKFRNVCMSKQKIRDSSEENTCYILWTKVGDSSGKEPACLCRRSVRAQSPDQRLSVTDHCLINP